MLSVSGASAAWVFPRLGDREAFGASFHGHEFARHPREIRAPGGPGVEVTQNQNSRRLALACLQVVLYQYDESDPMNPRGLLIA